MKSVNKKLILTLSAAFFVLATLFTNCGQPGFQLDAASKGDGGDPFLPFSWHLGNSGQSIFALAAGSAGNDLRLSQSWAQGYHGKGIKILISDSGVEDTHEDITGNFLYSNESKDYTKPAPYLSTTSPPYGADDNHGTPVAGLVAAVGWNGKGSRGVAPKASLLSANFISSQVVQTSARKIDQASGNFDISNMSWGTGQNSLYPRDTNYETQLKYMSVTGRSGLGTVFVKAAGNSFVVRCRNSTTMNCIGNSNFDGDDTNPYTIIVGALNASGSSATYSSAGSNLWISSFGGEGGDDSPAMFSTDRSGCDTGYAKSNAGSSLAFERGSAGNSGCNYTASFNGTSSASPIAAGAIALLMEANPALSWRDIKFILAKTADPVDYQTTGSIPHPFRDPLPTGYAWEQPWITNQAGFKFHNWYGFGRLNVDAALAMARNYNSTLGSYAETNFANDQSGLSIAIPDNSATGGATMMNVASNFKLEGVQLQLWATHPDVSELAVELTSPQGTKSIVVNMKNSLTGLANYQGEVFLSNAFYQERAQGNWTLKLIDGKAGQTGTITRWRLNFVGAN